MIKARAQHVARGEQFSAAWKAVFDERPVSDPLEL